MQEIEKNIRVCRENVERARKDAGRTDEVTMVAAAKTQRKEVREQGVRA